jgi:predicted permease
MKNLIQDVRYGVRMLFKQPAFSLAAAVVLALGIGGSTAMFSVVNTLMLKPLLIRDASQIVGVYSRDSTKPDAYRAFSYPNYAEVRDNNPAFSAVMGHNVALVGLTEHDNTRRVFTDLVSANYFSTLGTPLLRGREFTAAEEQPASGISVAIVSYSYWTKHGADPNLIGATRRLNGKDLTIVGITAEGFTGTTALISPEFYVPLGMYEAMVNDFDGHGRKLASRDNPALVLVGRMRPGVTAESAAPLLAPIAARMAQEYPAENKDQVLSAHALSRVGISDAPSRGPEVLVASILLLSMAAIVLLIASLNVANMMLVRGTARTKEIAIRQALGASRRSILQQLFTEGLVLALLGGVGGLALSYIGTDVLMSSLARLAPIDILYSGAPDTRVLIATFGFCVLSALLFSFGPARIFARTNIAVAIKSGESQEAGIGHMFSRRNILVMGQIALSMTLLTAAGLFIRSSMLSADVDPGFRMDNGIVMEVDPSLAGYDEAHGRALLRSAIDRLRNLPGIESVAMAATVPFGIVTLGRDVQVGGATPVSCRSNIVTEEYFKTIGIPLLQGRSFNSTETGDAHSARVVVLDRKAAEQLFPKGSAIGQHVRLFLQSNPANTADAEVIGIAGNIQEDVPVDAVHPHVYIPFGQEYQSDMNIHVRTAANPAALLEPARREVAAVDERLPVLELKTLRGHFDSSADLWLLRIVARMFTLFGGVALLLAMVGLYSIRAYTTTRRTREIGIRLALGAKPSEARAMILREGLIVTSIGAGTGLALSLLAGKALTSLLYKVSGADPIVFISSAVILGSVSLLACYLPALRASRVDPMIALRHE